MKINLSSIMAGVVVATCFGASAQDNPESDRTIAPSSVKFDQRTGVITSYIAPVSNDREPVIEKQTLNCKRGFLAIEKRAPSQEIIFIDFKTAVVAIADKNGENRKKDHLIVGRLEAERFVGLALRAEEHCRSYGIGLPILVKK
jgi:hypothetical protein